MPDMPDYAEEKRKVDLLAELAGVTPLKRVASTGGGEWAGPCPFCSDGGEDRLRVQPYLPEGGKWWCRVCSPDNRWHDVFDLREKLGKPRMPDTHTFPIARLDLDATQQERREAIDQFVKTSEAVRLPWAKSMWKRCQGWHRDLMSERGKSAREYLQRRGINEESMRLWTLGVKLQGNGTPGDPRGITIPCVADSVRYVKVRQPKNHEPKYCDLGGEGRQSFLFGVQTLDLCFDAFLVESELDAILGHQVARVNGWKVGFCSLPGRHTFRPPYLPYIAHIERWILIPDNDETGDDTVREFKRQLGSQVKVARVPDDFKDLGEFAESGADVFEFLYAATES